MHVRFQIMVTVAICIQFNIRFVTHKHMLNIKINKRQLNMRQIRIYSMLLE